MFCLVFYVYTSYKLRPLGSVMVSISINIGVGEDQVNMDIYNIEIYEQLWPM